MLRKAVSVVSAVRASPTGGPNTTDEWVAKTPAIPDGVNGDHDLYLLRQTVERQDTQLAELRALLH